MTNSQLWSWCKTTCHRT